jgi:hypothetical protein
MKFSKLPKEKRQHLILVVVGTIVVLGGLGNFLIKASYEKLSSFDTKIQAAAEKLAQMQKMVKRGAEVEVAFDETAGALAAQEASMATGDLYSWMQSNLRKFQRGYKVEIPQISPVSAPEPVNLLAKFPYQQASLSIAGTAYYHDLGRFIADFENTFPLMRVLNLSLELNPTSAAAERDKLAFKMDIVTLVKPGKI